MRKLRPRVEEATLVVRDVWLEIVSEGDPRLRTLGKDLGQGERYGLMAQLRCCWLCCSLPPSLSPVIW